jgi:hypothetical protein
MFDDDAPVHDDARDDTVRDDDDGRSAGQG